MAPNDGSTDDGDGRTERTRKPAAGDDHRLGRRGVLAAAGVGLSAALLGGVPADDGQAAQETPNATATPTRTETQPLPDVSFGEMPVREERGDVAEIPIQLSGTDRATLLVGSRQVNYLARVTVVDANGDGEVVVTLDTLQAGQGDGSGFGARGEDRLQDYELLTDPLRGPDEALDPLEDGLYDLQLRVRDVPVAGGALVLSEGQVEGIDVFVAPRAGPGGARVIESLTQRSTVAAGDWAVLGVRASGIYSVFEGAGDLDGEDTGLQLRVEETEALNRPPEEIAVENVGVVVRPAEDVFYVVLPRNALVAGSEYEATFTVTDAYPLVPEGESRTASTRFEVVERSAAFDGRPPLSLPAGEATLTGTATVAPGTSILVGVDGPGVADVTRTTVADDGTWSATLDLSSGEPGTRVTARVLDLSGPVRGVLVAAGTETPGAGTETPAEETPTPGEETPTPGEETPTPGEGTPTPGEGTPGGG